MAKTNFQDPLSGEIYSSHISGLQESVNKIETALNMKTLSETGVSLSEVYISENDRYRIFQAPLGKRNWVESPAPVIKKNDIEILTGFTLDAGGGAIILDNNAIESDVFTADVTYTLAEGVITDNTILNEQNLSNHINDNTAHGLGQAVINTPAINFGNNLIKYTGNDPIYPKISFSGKHYTNLPGKDGNCEDTNKWTVANGVQSLDTANKVFGANDIKVVSSSGMAGTLYKAITLDTSKYYLCTAYLYGTANVGISVGQSAADSTGGGSVTLLDFPKQSGQPDGMRRVGFKFQPTSANLYVSTYNTAVPGTQVTFYTDGVMINEISATEYSFTATYLMGIYPYVDSYGVLTNPYFENHRYNLIPYGDMNTDTNGDGVVDGFSKQTSTSITATWSLDTAQQAQKVDVTESTAGGVQVSIYLSNKLPVTAGNVYSFAYDYIYNRSMSNTHIELKLRWYNSVGTQIGSSLVVTVGATGSGTIKSENRTAPAGAMLVVLECILVVDTSGATATVWFKNAIMVQGSTVPTFKSSEIERFVLEGLFTSDDTITLENNKLSGQLWWKHRTLYGKDYDWQYYADYTGFKQLILGNNTLFPITGNRGIVIKYDGNVLTNFSGTPASADLGAISQGTGLFYVTVADADTSWTDTINPNNDEVKAFMNGWKAIAGGVVNNRYVIWQSVVDNSMPAGIRSFKTTAAVTSGSNVVIPIDNAAGLSIGDYLSVIGKLFSNITAINGNNVTVAGLTASLASGETIYLADNGTTNTNLLNWCKVNVAPKYDGYKLHYKLATFEPITDINVPIRGNLWSLVEGDNYVIVDSGMVLGEVASIVGDTVLYYINGNGAYLNSKVETINTVYKNDVADSNWTFTSSYIDARGNGYMSATYANTDTNATYKVDYQILKTIHVQSFGNIVVSYVQDVFSSIEGLSDAVSVLDNRKLDKSGGVLQNYSEELSFNRAASGTIILDIADGNVANVTLTGATIISLAKTFTTGKACSMTIGINQGSTPYPVTWDAAIRWDSDIIPDISIANKTYIIVLATFNGGQRLYGRLAMGGMTT